MFFYNSLIIKTIKLSTSLCFRSKITFFLSFYDERLDEVDSSHENADSSLQYIEHKRVVPIFTRNHHHFFALLASSSPGGAIFVLRRGVGSAHRDLTPDRDRRPTRISHDGARFFACVVFELTDLGSSPQRVPTVNSRFRL